MRWVGIDPGLDGAIAILTVGQDPRVASGWIFDAPTLAVRVGKQTRRSLNGAAIARLLETHCPEGECLVCIEAVSGRPPRRAKPPCPVCKQPTVRMGTTSSFQFGRGLGLYEGICAALCLAVRYVPPHTWKAYAQILGQEKDASRQAAARQLPHFASFLNRKRDQGRADALLIAHYARWHWNSLPEEEDEEDTRVGA